MIGLRSAVITRTHRAASLRFILFPMVHVAEQQFYDEVAAWARLCQLLVAEAVPAKDVPAQSWMTRHHWGHLVDQAAALWLESLGCAGALRGGAGYPRRVMFGAGYMPAVVDHLCGQLGSIAARPAWLTVAHAKS